MRCRVLRNDATRLRCFRDSVESEPSCARPCGRTGSLMVRIRNGVRLVVPGTARMEFPGGTPLLSRPHQRRIEFLPWTLVATMA